MARRVDLGVADPDAVDALPSYSGRTFAGWLLGLSATRERSADVAAWKADGCVGLHLVVSGGGALARTDQPAVPSRPRPRTPMNARCVRR